MCDALLHLQIRELLRYLDSCLVHVYHIGSDAHAGLELLQPAIARQAEQCHFSFEDGSQLLFLAAAAAACLAEASTALHVSLSVCWPSSAGCLSAGLLAVLAVHACPHAIAIATDT